MPKGIGGRPKRIGQLEFGDNGQMGVFVGYDDQGRKVAMDFKAIEDLMISNGQKLKIKVEYQKSSKPSLSLFLFKKLASKNLLEQLQEQITGQI